ncbi:MAG: histidinol dehydrogenase, partial [Burkholderiales bacterium]
MKLRRLSTRASGFERQLAALTRFDAAQDPSVRETVRRIVADVRKRGDVAVREYTRKFDGFAPRQFAVRANLIDAIPAAQARALRAAHRRIRAFHEKQRQQSWEFTDAEGARLGQKISPLARVGLYVPGGKAAYPSSVLMNAVPAKVAGVGELVMACPNPNPLVLAAAALAGVGRVIRVGGAQAIAALAYGTATIAAVDKIVGPGNAYVAAAKRRVFGRVGIDMIAGPSEILVVADCRNDPAWIAADLLSQAEHDEAAQAILVTDDAAFAARVVEAIERTLETLPRRAIAGESWR